MRQPVQPPVRQPARPRPRTAAVALAALALAAAAAGCAAAPAPRPGPAAHRPPARPAAAAAPAGQAQVTAQTSAPACNPDASSLAPLGPPEVTAGSFMATIKKQGYLIAGVDQSTYHFGYLNPLDGQIEGFDIAMIQAVAKAIFGSPDKVEYKAISDEGRIPDILNNSVDIVAHTMTITCQRLQQVDFSSVYFDAKQRVLVPSNVNAPNGLAGLAGQKVCATDGSDSLTTIADYPVHPKLIPVAVPFWTDCLVLLQQDQVSAVSTDDAILYGLQAQDPFTKVVGQPLEDEPYGLAIAKQHPDFVRFVNAVIAQYESDGGWEKAYKQWVNPAGEPPPVPRYAS